MIWNVYCTIVFTINKTFFFLHLYSLHIPLFILCSVFLPFHKVQHASVLKHKLNSNFVYLTVQLGHDKLSYLWRFSWHPDNINNENYRIIFFYKSALWLPVRSRQSLLSALINYWMAYLSTYLSTCLSTCLSVYLHVWLSPYLSVSLRVCLPTCLSVSVCLSTCLSPYPVRVECPSLLVHDSSSRGQTCCWSWVVWYGGVWLDGGLKALSPSGLAHSCWFL